jgi:hypothetical protein
MGEIINSDKIFIRKLKRKYHVEDIGVDGTIILKLILNCPRVWTVGCFFM